MPSGKDHKEDTWKESDLKKVLKPDDKKKSRDGSRKGKERSSRKSDDKREHKEWDDERKKRGQDDAVGREVDGRRRDRDRGVETDSHRDREQDRERDKDRKKEKDRERRKREEHRDKERTRERDYERDKRKEKEANDSEMLKDWRTRDRSKEREASKDRQKEKEGRDKESDRDRKRDRDTEKRKDKEGDNERQERPREQDRSKDRDRSKEKRAERDISKERRNERSSENRDRDQRKDRKSERNRDKDGSSDRTKEREDKDIGKERTKYREKDRNKRRERESTREREKDRKHHKERDSYGLARENGHSDKDDREKSDRHSKDSDRRSKNEESSQQRRQDDKTDFRREQRKDKDRRKEQSEKSDEKEKEDKIKRREKKLIESLKQEEELRKEHLKFRSDTVEEADVIDEDVVQNRKVALQRMPSEGAVEEVHDEENDGYAYDDDFEDYDEDFEDDDDEDDDDEDDETSVDVQDHSGLQELLQALNAENEGARASSREGREQSKEHKETDKEVRPSSTSHGRINFVAAKQKQISDKVASRTRRRGQELMRLIDLDVAVFDIFDLPPLNEYELYIKNFGRSDTKQAYVQCNENNVEKEVQTEEIEMRTKWTQNPATDASGFGDDEDNSQDDLSSLTEKANINSLRLANFLQRATQTCLTLLEECFSEQTSTQFKERRDMTCSDGFMQLSTKQSYLEGRPVKCVHISPVQTHFLLIAYSAVTDKNKVTFKTPNSIQDKGLVCVWNTNEPSNPQKVLICESTPQCCCLSPSKATLAFAGLEDGSLVAWDLRESSSMHYMTKVTEGDNEVVLRAPTFSTAGVLKKDESHLSPVVSVVPLVMPGDSARASGGSNTMSDDMLGLSFQLASLEENAVLYLWVVVELDKATSAGSESDLGLSPGGKIKLIKSSAISLQSPFRDVQNKASSQALILRFLPHDPNHVYVGTDGGYVIHCDRHGGRAPPKSHRPEIDNVERIAALDLSPWQLPCMLSGTESGNLWLFNLKNEFPLLSWPSSTSSSEILSVRWSHSRPSVFYVLDCNSNLHVWDLLKSDQGPIAVEKFKHGRVTCFELSSDYSASGIGIPGRNAELVLVYESGAVEIHRISSVFSKASGDDLDRFASYLDSVL